MQQVSSGVVDEPPHLIFKFARFRRQRFALVVFHVVVVVVLCRRQLVRTVTVVLERGVRGHPVEPEFDHPETVRAPTVNAEYSEKGLTGENPFVVNNVTQSAHVKNYYQG